MTFTPFVDYAKIDNFDLTVNRDSGQLWLDDRRELYSIVRTLKPSACVETGTWYGGGSTFIIASALMANFNAHERPLERKFGRLLTIESNPDAFNATCESYTTRWPWLKPFVSLNHGDSVEFCKHLVRRLEDGGRQLDFAFLDGGEDAIAAEFEDACRRSSGQAAFWSSHDWFNGKKIDALRLRKLPTVSGICGSLVTAQVRSLPDRWGWLSPSRNKLTPTPASG